MKLVTHHLYARPVQRQNARRHITRIAANYRRMVTDAGAHVPVKGFEVAARLAVLGAFEAYRKATSRTFLARAEA